MRSGKNPGNSGRTASQQGAKVPGASDHKGKGSDKRILTIKRRKR